MVEKLNNKNVEAVIPSSFLVVKNRHPVLDTAAKQNEFQIRIEKKHVPSHPFIFILACSSPYAD